MIIYFSKSQVHTWEYKVAFIAWENRRCC